MKYFAFLERGIAIAVTDILMLWLKISVRYYRLKDML